MLLARSNLKEHLELTMLGQIAYTYHILGEYEAAIYYYKKQLQLSWDLGEKGMETRIFDNIGIEYYYLGNIEKSVYYHNTSMAGGPKLDDRTKGASIISKKSKLEEYRQACLLKAGAASFQSSDSLEEAYLREKSSTYLLKMKYIREKDFSEELTRNGLEKIKQKLKAENFPSPRKMVIEQKSQMLYAQRELANSSAKKGKRNEEEILARTLSELTITK